jgi:hydrogenase maturation protease
MSLSLEELRLRPGESVLVYGIGNVGRQDDGIGVRLVERLERDAECVAGRDGTTQLTLEANYQLGIEDAMLLSRFDVVLFLDASHEPTCAAPFTVYPVAPSDSIEFTTHAMSFSSVLSICAELYQRMPRTFLVAIPGYEWNISDELSPLARGNLEDAFASLSMMLEPSRRLGKHASESEPSW